MGMYDYLAFEVPLPHGAENVKEWQTKNFNCELHRYVIKSDGSLIHEESHYEIIPEDEKLFFGFGADKWGNPIIRTVSDGEVRIDYHGYIYAVGQAPGNKFVELKIKFTDGLLKEISIEEPR